jgi:hypothetical protein
MNYAGACERCNNKKGTLSLLEFMMVRQGRFGYKERALPRKRHKRFKHFSHRMAELPNRWFDPLGIQSW